MFFFFPSYTLFRLRCGIFLFLLIREMRDRGDDVEKTTRKNGRAKVEFGRTTEKEFGGRLKGAALKATRRGN